MHKRVPNALLDALSEFLSTQMGLYFHTGRRLDLLRGLRSAAVEFGFDDVETCIHWLLEKPLTKSQIEILASHLTIGETYFFREPKVFAALEKHILPTWIKERSRGDRRIRIWSAGCCTGEEPYSLAILLDRVIPDLEQWNIRILATDINPIFLRLANAGIYREWSFRGTPYWLKETYFTPIPEGGYEIHPRISKMVSFQYLNLVEDVFPSIFNETNAMDLIFCRNVLMYFSPEQVRHCVERFYNCLVEGAYLVVASSETSPLFSDLFVSENFPGAILYHKVSGKTGPVQFLTPSSYLQYDEKPVVLPPQPKGPSCNQPPISRPVKPVSPQSIPETPKEDDLSDATRCYEEGRYGEAVVCLRRLLEKQPRHSEALALLAKTLANQGELAESLTWCEKALSFDKLNPEFHHLHAVILVEMGKMEEAMTALKRVLYLEPDFIMAHFMMGNISLQIGKNGESAKYFRNALRLLERYQPEEILPNTDGITVAHLREMIHTVVQENRS